MLSYLIATSGPAMESGFWRALAQFARSRAKKGPLNDSILFPAARKALLHKSFVGEVGTWEGLRASQEPTPGDSAAK